MSLFNRLMALFLHTLSHQIILIIIVFEMRSFIRAEKCKFLAFSQHILTYSHFQGSAGFRSHAGRIITVFDEAIASLSDDNYLAALENIWSKIGDSHNKRKISRQAFHVSTSFTFTINGIIYFGIFVLYVFYSNNRNCETFFFPF